MSRKKGLSLDEKRTKMLEIFHHDMEPYTLKDLEKIAPKRKGITQQSVKDVVQSLVDDDMLLTDKCGIVTIFWSFPSASAQYKRVKHKGLEERIAERQQSVATMEAHIATLEAGREDTEERSALEKELQHIEAEERESRDKLASISECDPETVKRLRESTTLCSGAVNRWTENIFTLKSYVGKTFGISDADIHAQFDIPEDLDYMDEIAG